MVIKKKKKEEDIYKKIIFPQFLLWAIWVLRPGFGFQELLSWPGL
jgi:hypothetical protein